MSQGMKLCADCHWYGLFVSTTYKNYPIAEMVYKRPQCGNPNVGTLPNGAPLEVRSARIDFCNIEGDPQYWEEAVSTINKEKPQ